MDEDPVKRGVCSETDIGRAWLEGDATTLRGRFLCSGHSYFTAVKRHVLPPPVQPPPDYVGPGANGWQPHSWRMELMMHEKQLRQGDTERLVLVNTTERARLTAAKRALLPQLTLRDIRRFRLPLVQSLPLDLEDDGFPMTASIIEGFIHYNEQMRVIAPKGSPFYEEPPLAQRPQLLLQLASGISEVEAAGQTEPPRRAEQIDRLLELAAELRQGGETLFWVVEKLLLIACDVAAAHPLDGYRREAQARYAYGDFLYNIGQLAPAVEQLERSRCLSLSKEWAVTGDIPAERQLGPPLGPLEVPNLLSEASVALQARALLGLAQRCRTRSPSRAVRLCSRGLRRLGSPNLAAVEAQLLLELGLAYKEQRNFPMARTALAMYLDEFSAVVPSEGRCVALLEVARCLSQLGDVHAAQEYLLQVLELAKNSGLKELTALSLQCMGEGFLAIRYFRTGSECLAKAFELYLELGMTAEMDKLRVLAAMAKGLEIMPYLSVLLSNIFEGRSITSMVKLLSWRLHRVPFWRPRDGKGPAEGPQLPRAHLYTSVHVPEEDLEGEERKILAQAEKLREEAVEAARDEADSRSAALKQIRAERLKVGARVNVYHPAFDIASNISRLSSLLVPDDTPSISDVVRQRESQLTPDAQRRRASLTRVTEELLDELVRNVAQEGEDGEGGSTDSNESAGAAAARREDAHRDSPTAIYHPQSTPTLRTAVPAEKAFGKVTQRVYFDDRRKHAESESAPEVGAESGEIATAGRGLKPFDAAAVSESSVTLAHPSSTEVGSPRRTTPLPEASSSSYSEARVTTHASREYPSTSASARYPITPIPEDYSTTSRSMSSPMPEGYFSTPMNEGYASSSTVEWFPSSPVSDGRAFSPMPEGYLSTPAHEGYVSTPMSGEYPSTSIPEGYASTPISEPHPQTPISDGHLSTPIAERYGQFERYPSTPTPTTYTTSIGTHTSPRYLDDSLLNSNIKNRLFVPLTGEFLTSIIPSDLQVGDKNVSAPISSEEPQTAHCQKELT